MTQTRKRRYVGNANVKRRQEVEESNNTLPRRFNEMNFLPSPEKHKALPTVEEKFHRPTPPTAAKPVKEALVDHMHAHQRATKAYKLEPWYKSGAGCGSVANMVAAALSASDKNQSGYISSDDVIFTMQQSNFGLKEQEVRQLLKHYDSALTPRGSVHYRTFAKQFDEPYDREQDKIEDPLMRQERFIAALRQRVAAASQIPVPSAIGRRRLKKNEINTTKLETIASPDKEIRLPPVPTTAVEPTSRLEFSVEDLDSNLRVKLPSPTRYSAKNAPGVIPQTKTTFVIGGDMRNTPNSLKRAKLMPQIIDQQHRDSTRQAKRHIIADHLERINAYAAESDYKAKVTEENHIKATSTKLLKYHQAFFEAQSQHAEKVHQKGLIHSEVAKLNHNVSQESMFCPR
ncbi:hypothetical protein Ae201684P_010923 [Aphanomyces euteiches]|nr:hypothetical protein Ae201684P_010923 [Aphanomyces euteiches]